MKIKSLLAAVAAIFLFTSCGSLKNMENSTDFGNGSAAGTVLKALATQYISNGSIDFANVQNILNVASLANSLTSLKSESNQAKIDFSSGLMSTNNMVNQSNVSGIVSGLTGLSQLNLAGITNAMQKGTASAADANKLKSQLEGVLSLLKK